MRDVILPWAVMAVTIIIALGLMTFFRRLLKLREEVAPEVVHPRKDAAEPAAPVYRDLAA